MDKNLSVLVSLSCVIVILALFGIKEATAICTPDILEDWPDAPCGLPLSTEKLRQDWQGYYEFKGKEWMEEKRVEMEKAILSSTLEQWRTDGANYNVWLYYKITNNIPEVPPIKQFKFGIPLTEIKCKENLILLKKASNELPICVSIKTSQKLLERKFAQTTIFGLTSESPLTTDGIESYREITILSISPQNVTLPEPKNQTYKTKCNADGVCFTPE